MLEVRSEGALDIENGTCFRLREGLVEGEPKVKPGGYAVSETTINEEIR